MAPAAEVPRPPRMPKLSYRNRLPADQSPISPSAASTGTSSSNSSRGQHPSTPITPVSTQYCDSRSTPSSKSSSLASSNGSMSRDSEATPTKKKKNGVLNFLTLKEPSQMALKQFADAQRKQSNGNQATSIGLQRIPSQKLPSSVPKVNSKWDGLPESVKSPRNSMSSKKSRTSSSRSHNQFSCSTTFNSSIISVATNDSRGPPNSLASPMQSTVHVSEYAETSSAPKPHSRSDSPSTASLSEMTSFFSDDGPSSTAASPAFSAEQHPWSPPPRPPLAITVDAVVFTAASGEQISTSEPNVSRSKEVDAIFRRLKGEVGKSVADPFGAYDEDSDVPDTHDFLFEVEPVATKPQSRVIPRQASVPPLPPSLIPRGRNVRPPANFSRPRPNLYSQHHKPGAPALPTLYESSIASTDDLDVVDESPELGRTTTRTSTESSSAPSIAPSTAPSVAPSFTPSVMSESWYRSPRERLGLGGRIRKSDILPWEGQPKKAHRAEPVLHPLHMHPLYPNDSGNA